MIKSTLYFFMLIFTLSEASAQKIPRPGGGGEDIDVYGEKYSDPEIVHFYRLFKQQLKKCDPKRKVKMDFEHVFNYLFQLHIEIITRVKLFETKPRYSCFKDERENNDKIECMLNKRLKQSLNILIENHYVEEQLKKQKNLSKDEIVERIEFLKHLVEK